MALGQRILASACTIAAMMSGAAGAETIQMLSVGALRHSSEPTVAEFRQSTGHVVSILPGTAGLTQKRLILGAPCDVVGAPSRTLEALAKEGKVDIRPPSSGASSGIHFHKVVQTTPVAQGWIDVLRAGPTRARLQKAGFETP